MQVCRKSDEVLCPICGKELSCKCLLNVSSNQDDYRDDFFDISWCRWWSLVVGVLIIRMRAMIRTSWNSSHPHFCIWKQIIFSFRFVNQIVAQDPYKAPFGENTKFYTDSTFEIVQGRSTNKCKSQGSTLTKD